MPDIWIQLENRPWDTMPHNIDRMNGRSAKDITGKVSELVTITSPATGASQQRRMYAPLRDSSGKVMDALIFRRYKPPVKADQSDAWTVPDDRKVNPWDINEQDATDNGTMGTIPGPVIECNVGDSLTVHFRNMDMRLTKALKARTHSMHVHGFVFRQEHDGAYPLSNADPTQRVDGTTPNPGQITASDETALWNSIAPAGSTTFGTLKRGDRVPPGGTFVYTWNTFGWPSTAGVWLYHDHSFCDMENIRLGAIGMAVIHNPADTQSDFVLANTDFPDNDPNGNPIAIRCIPFGAGIPLSSNLLQQIGTLDPEIASLIAPPVQAMNMGGGKKASKMKAEGKKMPHSELHPNAADLIQAGDFLLHVNKDLTGILGICFRHYKAPPAKALYMQLYHEMDGQSGMCINGRSYLGNTPSVVAGVGTKMRFGVVGMGGTGGIHTFHIHGHRWIIPGPHGNTPAAIQGSVVDTPVSQFEDTRIFGPANSFVFFINGAAGSFMRAGGPTDNDAKGEWHMHCHVLDHMMNGMMGSLLVVGANDAVSLPVGEECPDADVAPPATVQHDVSIDPPSQGFPVGSFSQPSALPVKMGDTVRFTNNDPGQPHGVHWLTAGSPPDSAVLNHGDHYDALMTTAGTFNYQCLVHGATMPGSIMVTM
jgi:FtsP/CotA-like multicopper oxidase with cupredoxin domain/plastocyanin